MEIGKNLIVTKSLKDYIILKKFFTEVIYVQNESKSALNKKTIKALQKCYSTIYVWFDTDRAGLSAMWWYRKHYNFTPVFFRNTKLSIWQNLTKNKQISDPADFVKTYGITNFEKWLKINKLL